MDDGFTRISVRAVSLETVERLWELKCHTLLPMGALLEQAISALWAEYFDDQDEQLVAA